MLDEGAKEWLTLIESKKKELLGLEAQLKTEKSRCARIKIVAKRVACEELLAKLSGEKETLSKSVDSETELFFKRIFGVELYKSVALRRKDGTLSAALYVSKLLVRQLTNGAGVFTVMGDSATTDLHKGLPECVSLMARETEDEWLVAV